MPRTCAHCWPSSGPRRTRKTRGRSPLKSRDSGVWYHTAIYVAIILDRCHIYCVDNNILQYNGVMQDQKITAAPPSMQVLYFRQWQKDYISSAGNELCPNCCSCLFILKCQIFLYHTVYHAIAGSHKTHSASVNPQEHAVCPRYNSVAQSRLTPVSFLSEPAFDLSVKHQTASIC